MLTRSALATTLVIIVGASAIADFGEDIATMQAEVATAKAEHEMRLSFEAAPKTLEAVFEAHEVEWAQKYAEAWGQNGLFLEWDKAREFHDRVDRRLREWEAAVRGGKYSVDIATPLLEEGMRAFRIVNQDMHGWFDEYLLEKVQNAHLLDAAQTALRSKDDKLAQYCLELSKHISDNSQRPQFIDVSKFEVIPPVPQEGDKVASARDLAFARANRIATNAMNSGSAVDIRHALNEAQRVIRTYPNAQTDELNTVLQILEERLLFEESSVTELLDQAEQLEPGSLRDAILDETRDRLMDRMGHLAPLIATSLSEERSRDDVVSDLLDMARRIEMLSEDSKDSFSAPSGWLRAVNGLKSAAGLLNMANDSDTRSREILDVIQDAAAASPSALSPTAPFSIPAAMVSAQLDRTLDAWDQASFALDGVADAIRGNGDGLVRAERAARKLESLLNPHAFARDLQDSFVNTVVSNLPFTRSLIDHFRQ